MAQESLLFWEYAEDFRRGHPASTQPLIPESTTGTHSPNTINSSTADSEAPIRKWARGIYDSFIADGSPMQVAISGEAKSVIERVILNDSILIESDIFKQTQNQLFNHLKFQLFPSFIQQTNYRAILMSAVNHKVYKVRNCYLFVLSHCSAPLLVKCGLIHPPHPLHYFSPHHQHCTRISFPEDSILELIDRTSFFHMVPLTLRESSLTVLRSQLHQTPQFLPPLKVPVAGSWVIL